MFIRQNKEQFLIIQKWKLACIVGIRSCTCELMLEICLFVIGNLRWNYLQILQLCWLFKFSLVVIIRDSHEKCQLYLLIQSEKNICMKQPENKSTFLSMHHLFQYASPIIIHVYIYYIINIGCQLHLETTFDFPIVSSFTFLFLCDISL